MRRVIDICRKNGKVFSSLNQILPKELASRKRVGIYLGVDLKKYYTMIIFVAKKSRILRKEAMELMELHKRLERYNDSKILKRCIIIDAPLCSKAKRLMLEDGWDVVELQK